MTSFISDSPPTEASGFRDAKAPQDRGERRHRQEVQQDNASRHERPGRAEHRLPRTVEASATAAKTHEGADRKNQTGAPAGTVVSLIISLAMS